MLLFEICEFFQKKIFIEYFPTPASEKIFCMVCSRKFICFHKAFGDATGHRTSFGHEKLFLSAVWICHGQLWAIILGLTHPMLVTVFAKIQTKENRRLVKRLGL